MINFEPNSENQLIIYDESTKNWYCFRNPLKILMAAEPVEIIPLLDEMERTVSEKGCYAAGFVSYEAASGFDPSLKTRPPGDFPLAWFGIFSPPEKVELPEISKESFPDVSWNPGIKEQEYSRGFRKIKDYISAGDTYQVNYTFRLNSESQFNAWEYFLRMIKAQGPGYGAFLRTRDFDICSASPELFFRLDGEKIISRPMKGTAPRGLWCEEDVKIAQALINSEKNRAENVMIVDMVRNDMGRIAEKGSVRVPELCALERYPTVWHLTSTVEARSGAPLSEIFRAMFPPASITGAPKCRTMEIIGELESTPRKLYTGTIGFLAPGRKAQFNVAIRTLLKNRHSGISEYGVGGGIVWDSIESSEFRECITKAEILTKVFPPFDLLETILWTPQEGFFLLGKHLERIAGSASYFSRNIDIDEVRKRLNEEVKQLSAGVYRIRLILKSAGEVNVESKKIDSSPVSYQVGVAEKPVNSRNTFLYHKTTHRSVYEQARSNSPEMDDVILWNERNEITESTIANVVVKKNGEYITPPVKCGLLPGVYRSYLLEKGEIREAIISKEELEELSEIYLINSVRGIWRVRLVGK